MFQHRNLLVQVFVFLIGFAVISTLDDSTDDSISLNFEDNIEGKFVSFAKNTIRLSRQSTLDLTPSRSISSAQYQRVIDAIQDQSYYTVKVHFKRGAVQDHVMTSIPMCFVLQAQFQYSMTLFLNENGYIIGVHASTGNSTCSVLNINELGKRNEYIYRTGIRLQMNDVGPQPEIQSFLDKIKRQQEAKLSSQESDNRPFILRYWKYIVPIVVIFVLQTVFTNDGGGTGASNGGAQ